MRLGPQYQREYLLVGITLERMAVRLHNVWLAFVGYGDVHTMLRALICDTCFYDWPVH
jgi:hypothetical protein